MLPRRKLTSVEDRWLTWGHVLDVLEPGWSPVEYLLFPHRWQGARMDEAFTGQAACMARAL